MGNTPSLQQHEAYHPDLPACADCGIDHRLHCGIDGCHHGIDSFFLRNDLKISTIGSTGSTSKGDSKEDHATTTDSNCATKDESDSNDDSKSDDKEDDKEDDSNDDDHTEHGSSQSH